MEPGRFYRASRVVLVAGKGGVGKTTVAAAFAAAAARSGLDVLLFSLGDPLGIPALFGSGEPLTSAERVLFSDGEGQVRSRLLVPDSILLEYLVDHGFGRIARRLGTSGVLDVVATAVPGIREILILGKLKQLERADVADLFVIDAPATGHARKFLTSASGLSDAARAGPLRAQADAASALLADPTKTQLILVTIPEETPVNELIETAFAVEDETAITLGPIVVNDCLPFLGAVEGDPAIAAAAAGVTPSAAELDEIARAARFRLGRQELQDDQLRRLAAELPLTQVRLPHLFVPELDAPSLLALADALDAGIAESVR